MGNTDSGAEVIRQAATLVFLASSPAVGDDCDPSRLDVRWTDGTAAFAVEIADDPPERALGLMNRDTLNAAAGMLFVYPDPRPATFWMRNTRIPLDMLFIGADGRVTQIHRMAIPYDESTIFGGDSVQYVLEINGGQADRLGIPLGAEVRHAVIDGDDVSWRCDSP